MVFAYAYPSAAPGFPVRCPNSKTAVQSHFRRFAINISGKCQLKAQLARVVASRLTAMNAVPAVNGVLKQLQ